MATSPPPVPNLHLHQLAYLREVARCDSLAEAARRLHLSQPALSQSLDELERRLPSRLFVREGRRRRLSAEGELVLEFARRTLGEAAELERELARREAGGSGRLRVGMIDAASLYLLPRAVRRFREEHPGVRLELSVAGSNELLSRLRLHELDLAVVVGPAPSDGLEAEELAREPLRIHAPAGDRGRPADAAWALYPPGSRTRELIDAALARKGLRPRVLLESGNPQVLRQMVALGQAWAVLPSAVAEQAPEGLARKGRGALLQRPIVLVLREGGSEDPRATAFRRMARELRWGR